LKLVRKRELSSVGSVLGRHGKGLKGATKSTERRRSETRKKWGGTLG